MDSSKTISYEIMLDWNGIKKCLLSRKIEKKILAARRLFQYLKENPYEEFHVKLINADFIEMLCEASCTTNIYLLKYVFKCFFLFIECPQFFQQNRTAYTLESVIRALQILIKSEEKNDILILGLQLVCDIICRLNRQGASLSNICNIPNLINLVRHLFAGKYSKLNVYVGAEILISLLHSKGIVKFKKIMEDTVSEVLKLLVEMSNKSKDENCIIILSEVVNGSMRFLVYPRAEVPTEISKSTLFIELFMAMKEILVPFLSEYKGSLHEHNWRTVKIILSALLSIYHYPEEPITEEFSHLLVFEGYLILLPSLEAQCNELELIIVMRSLLFELLQCLCSSVLGRENWKSLLLPGFEVLPLGGSYTSILYHGSSEVVPIASIIFNYFYLISSSNPNVNRGFLKSLSCYILSLSGKPPASIMKAVWFTFAVAYLCSKESYHQAKFAMVKLTNYLLQYKIDSVYTHHPAILYWLFADDSVPHELQAKVIKFWLDENDEESTSELKSLLIINQDSCLVMMGLMASENKLTSMIHKIISSILFKSNSKDRIIEHAWFILPQYLAQFSSLDVSQYECLINVMKLCCTLMPKTVDMSLVLRISCLLPGAFSKYFNHISSDKQRALTFDDHQSDILKSSFRLVNYLVEKSLEINDKRVPAVYLKHEALLNAIELIFTSGSDTLNTSVMHLLTTLIRSQKYTNQLSEKIIQVDIIKLIQFLCGTTELSIATLKFLVLYLEHISENTLTPAVNIPLPTAIQLRTLYLQIHMLCIKSNGEASVYGWLCIRRLLELSDKLGLKEHLAGIPYTPTLLLKSAATEGWKEAISFISSWLPSLPSSGARSLNIPYSVRTLRKLNDKLSKMRKDSNVASVLSKILQYSNKCNWKEKKMVSQENI